MLFLILYTIFYKFNIRTGLSIFYNIFLQDFGDISMQRRGTTNLPLHGGHTPRWLFDRMTKLSGAISEVVIAEYGVTEFLNRISNPYWFQAFYLKSSNVEDMIHSSKLSAKVDNSCLQDGYNLYVHNFFITEKGDWAVVQQGMNTTTKYARRYHWMGENVTSFLEDPHNGISCDKKENKALNMASKDSVEAQKISVDLINDNPDHLRNYFKRKDSNQLLLTDFSIEETNSLTLPPHHQVLDMDLSDKEFEVLKNAWEIQPENYEELILLQGIGPKKIRALALISDLVFGEPASWKDPVKYSFSHGGKDGFPYPVDRDVYDNSIATVKDALYQAKLDKYDKMKALKRLDDFIS